MRDDEQKALLTEVSLFCIKHKIPISNIDEIFELGGHLAKPYKLQIYITIMLSYSTVIYMQLQELNNCFSEENIGLLLCMTCLSPSNLFCAFDKQKLIHLAEFYPHDFFGTDFMAFDI